MGGAIPKKAPARQRAERAQAAPAREKARVRHEADASAQSDKPQLTKKSAADRRSAQRRSRTKSRERGLSDNSPGARNSLRRIHFIPANFWWMAVGLAAAFIVASLISLSLPPMAAVGCGLAGAAVAFLGKFVAEWERSDERDPNTARLIAFAIIAGSALLGGTGVGIWLYFGGLDFRVGIAILVSLNAAFAMLIGGKTGLMFTSKVAAWLPLVVIDGGVFAWAGLALATAVSAAIARYQAIRDRNAAEQAEAEARVRDRAQSILSDYEETGQGWFWETDRRGALTYLSKSVFRTLRKSERDLIGKPFTALFELADNNREGERTLTFHLSSRSSFQELAVRASLPNEERWWSINGRPVYDGFKNFCGFRGSGTDLTEKKRSQENANRLAQFDSLTGLANRLQMSETLEKILNSAHERERECSVFLLDLDRFKNVNDTLGHPAGDALLQQVSQRLERAVGQMGRCGRLGGDEFKVIVPGRSSHETLSNLAHEIIQSLSQPYSIEGQRVVIGASVGIAVAPDNGLTSESVIRNADLALYAAKDGGRGRYHFYSNDLHTKAEERNKLEQDLRDAIAHGGLELHYQPVVDAETETISGFEALLRWHHETEGWLSPDKFIPIAEDANLIGAIGEWALRTACHDLARWPESVRCAVNVSTLQFTNPQFATVVANAIAQAGISPERLELELTESVFLNENDGTDAMFAALKRIGVRLALDDFGTGYSSLGYLKRAPFDKIKIDQSFVRGATQPGSRNGAIIESITSLAQSLGMDTTAEGVETLDELDLVKSYGCSHIQGFVYSRAMSSAKATERLAEGLSIVPTGYRSARLKRQTMLRKVVLEHGGQYYNGTIRNMSASGACVDGLWNVPPGTSFIIALSDDVSVQAESIWSKDDRMGVKFARLLETEDDGSLSLLVREKSSYAAPGIKKASNG